jgi:hypothetical protein
VTSGKDNRYLPGGAFDNLRGVNADERLRALGVPEHLLYRTAFNWAEREPYLDVQHPGDVSLADLSMLAKRGFGLRVDPVGEFDLRELHGPLAELTEITLGPERRGNYVGIDALESAIASRGLFLQFESKQVADLSNLPHLREVGCRGNQTISVAMNPNLRVLRFNSSKRPRGIAIQAPLEELWVGSGSWLTDLSMLRDASRLRRLEIRATSFDVGSLRSATALGSVEFNSCRELIGIDALLTLPNLVLIKLFGANNIPNANALERFRGAIYVENNHAFDENFRARVRDRELWSISRYVPRATKAAAPPSRVDLSEGTDTSFPPFEIDLTSAETYELSYSDWDNASDVFGLAEEMLDGVSGLVEDVMRQILTVDAPELMHPGVLVFDSEAEGVHLQAGNSQTIHTAARALSAAWPDRRRMRRLAKNAQTHERP